MLLSALKTSFANVLLHLYIDLLHLYVLFAIFIKHLFTTSVHLGIWSYPLSVHKFTSSVHFIYDIICASSILYEFSLHLCIKYAICVFTTSVHQVCYVFSLHLCIKYAMCFRYICASSVLYVFSLHLCIKYAICVFTTSVHQVSSTSVPFLHMSVIPYFLLYLYIHLILWQAVVQICSLHFMTWSEQRTRVHQQSQSRPGSTNTLTRGKLLRFRVRFFVVSGTTGQLFRLLCPFC